MIRWRKVKLAAIGEGGEIGRFVGQVSGDRASLSTAIRRGRKAPKGSEGEESFPGRRVRTGSGFRTKIFLDGPDRRGREFEAERVCGESGEALKEQAGSFDPAVGPSERA